MREEKRKREGSQCHSVTTSLCLLHVHSSSLFTSSILLCTLLALLLHLLSMLSFSFFSSFSSCLCLFLFHFPPPPSTCLYLAHTVFHPSFSVTLSSLFLCHSPSSPSLSLSIPPSLLLFILLIPPHSYSISPLIYPSSVCPSLSVSIPRFSLP